MRFLDLKNIYRHQNHHPKCFSSKIVAKWWTQRIHVRLTSKPLKIFFNLLKHFYSSYHVVKFGNILLITSLAKEVVFAVALVCLSVCLSVNNITKKVMNRLE